MREEAGGGNVGIGQPGTKRTGGPGRSWTCPVALVGEPASPPLCPMREDEACLCILNIDQLCSFGPPRP